MMLVQLHLQDNMKKKKLWFCFCNLDSSYLFYLMGILLGLKYILNL